MRGLNTILTDCVAQSNSNSACTSSSGFNISSQSDLDNLAQCTTLTGDLVIQSQLASGTLNTVKTITGNLEILQDITMTYFSAPALQSIGGTFQLINLTILSSLSMPSLTSVGAIDFEILPALQALNFGGVTSAANVLITDTQLASLNGIQLSTVGTFDINNNFYLKSVSQPSLTAVTSALTIAFNAAGVQVNLPALTTIQNATFRDVGDVQLPSLDNVTGDLGFVQNGMSTINMQNLTSIGQSLSFVNNSALTNVTAPKLATIGGTFLIANNSDYSNIEFNQVTSVGGSIDWTGTFSMASLSALK